MLSDDNKIKLLAYLEGNLLTNLTWDYIVSSLAKLTDEEKVRFAELSKTNDFTTLVSMAQKRIRSDILIDAKLQLDSILEAGCVSLEQLDLIIK
jgi:hypothetical protein